MIQDAQRTAMIQYSHDEERTRRHLDPHPDGHNAIRGLRHLRGAELLDGRRREVWIEDRNGEDRIHLWLEAEGYLVVLAVRSGYVILWTTFYVSQDHQRRKYARRFEEAQKKLMPPRRKNLLLLKQNILRLLWLVISIVRLISRQ